MSPIIPLALQAGLALVALTLLRRRVYPAVSVLPFPGIVLDVWGPLLVAIPLSLFLLRSNGDVAGIGAVSMPGPIAAGWIVLVVGRMVMPGDVGRSDHGSWGFWPAGIWALTGLVLLLLGAAHDMPAWIGQCAFALLAVLMWMNTPSITKPAQVASPETQRASSALLLALVASIFQGIAAVFVIPELLPVSAGLLIGFAIMATSLSIMSGWEGAVRVGGWTATYGVLLSLAVLALKELVPSALSVVATGRSLPLSSVAHGFGVFAPEAVGLILLGPAARHLRRIPWWVGVVMGAILILLLAMDLATRIAGI